MKVKQVFEDNTDNLYAITIDDVFTEEECKEWIEITEEKGYEPATVNLYGTQVVNKQFRDNGRCVIISKEMANKIYDRVSEFIPNLFKSCEKVSINERLGFLRYYIGQEFKAHKDGTVISEDGLKRSYITLQLYLNDVEQGGETIFLNNDEDPISVSPKSGRVLLFQHDILHKGSAVSKGVKYVVRTDIYYKNN